jgi:GT2 family glycosyltransferase
MIKVSIVIPTKDREKDLNLLLNSIKNSTLKNYEIIIVNNSSNELNKKFYDFEKVTKVIENHKNLGLAKARNQGAELSRGEYVLFVDDDNIFEKNCITNLSQTLDENENFLACGPATYYYSNKDKIWFLGNKYNFNTSLFNFYYNLEFIKKINNRFIETDTLHNCFMVRKMLGEKCSWFDEKLYLSGTEFDFFLKLNNKVIGKNVTDIKAICFHNVPNVFNKNLLRRHGISDNNSKRLYYIQRNRAIIIKRYGSIINQISLFFFYIIFLLYYFIIILRTGKLELQKENFLGVLDGYRYLLTKKLK